MGDKNPKQQKKQDAQKQSGKDAKDKKKAGNQPVSGASLKPGKK